MCTFDIQKEMYSFWKRLAAGKEGGKSALTHGVCALVKSSEAPSGLAESWIKIGVT